MRLRRLLLPWIAGLIACRGADGPEHGWLVTTSLSAAEFASGDRLDITVVAHNTSSEARHLTPVCVHLFQLLDVDGTPRTLPPRLPCTMMITTPKDVAPGDSVVSTDHWDGMIPGSGGASVPAPPGDYLVLGRVFAPDEVTGSGKRVRLLIH